ncbi:MAG: amidohydrolase [Dehalococcoidia bacterium]
MNPSNPEGTHVAVRDGRILGVGTLAEVAGWGEYTLDDTFEDKVLVPGMIEAHAHILEGALAQFPYTGYFDRTQPDGSVAPGFRSYAELIDRLKMLDAQMTDPDEPLIVQGFDPIYFHGEPRLGVRQLDQASASRPIFVLHASVHLATVNTAMLHRHGITRDTTTAGVGRDADGAPNGELQEFAAMALAASGFKSVGAAMVGSGRAIWDLGYAARNAGITTVTDLGGQLLNRPEATALWRQIVDDPAYPVRVAVYNIPVSHGASTDFETAAVRLFHLRDTASSDKLRFPGVKFVIDGSIQGWTAVLNEPGYYTGQDHGQLLTDPKEFKAWMLPFHRAGVNIHVHCNGDRTVDVFLDAVEELLKEVAWLDHRHTCQHSQLTTAAQYRRMAKLGVCANLFTNHIWYWGDQHYEQTVGPERANRMEACATAKREGVHFSMHSDAAVTPLGHLQTMWCAVNRVTPKGRVLGEHEQVSAYDALYACTIDAAYQMHLDHEIGSIECGKWADFTVLDESPLDVEPMKIRDIGVWGTVVGGIPFAVPQPSEQRR